MNAAEKCYVTNFMQTKYSDFRAVHMLCILSCSRLRLAFNWMIYAFAGYLATDQVRNGFHYSNFFVKRIMAVGQYFTRSLYELLTLSPRYVKVTCLSQSVTAFEGGKGGQLDTRGGGGGR